MPGIRHQDRSRCADLLSRVGAILWLVTALSVLQWQAPTVDPSALVRLHAGAGQDAGLAVTERASPAVEARAATGTVSVEKRSSGGWSPAADGGALDTAAVRIPDAPGTAGASPVFDQDAPRATAARAFAARGPPALG